MKLSKDYDIWLMDISGTYDLIWHQRHSIFDNGQHALEYNQNLFSDGGDILLYYELTC